MNFECCSGYNRKKGKKLVKSTIRSCSHPKDVICGWLACNLQMPYKKTLKIAKVGSRYFYFCDEYCYLNWLRRPSTMYL